MDSGTPPRKLIQAVHDNLRNLGLDVLDVVNFRSLHGAGTGSHGPAEGSIEAPLTVLAELRHKGLVSYRLEQCHACADR
jgi:pyridoxine 4-dehydrogenase